MKKFIFFLGIIFLLGTTNAFAQRELTKINKKKEWKRFSTDYEQYIKELDKELMGKNKTESCKQTLKDFQLFWASADLKEEHRDAIIASCNLMLDRRLKVSPYFISYLQVIMQFIESDYSEAYFKEWHTIVQEDIIPDKKIQPSKIDFLFRFTASLLSDSSLLNQQNIKEWKVENNNFRFERDDPIKVTFPTTNLYCYLYNQRLEEGEELQPNVAIYETTGAFYPLDKDYMWKGKGGRVYWTKAGLPEDSVYADFDTYEIQLKRQTFEVENVKFVNKRFSFVVVNEGVKKDYLLGHYEDNIRPNVAPENSDYPQFTAYGMIRLDNIIQGINYRGGFTQRGSRIFGSSVDNQKSYLEVIREDTIAMKAYSDNFIFSLEDINQKSQMHEYFVIDDKGNRIKKSSKRSIVIDKISGKNSFVSIPIGNDSIYHYGLKFRYYIEIDTIDRKSEIIDLVRIGERMEKNIFYNSYHQLEMDFEILHWNLAGSSMDFNMLQGPTTTEKEAKFTSMQNFDSLTYVKIGFGMRVHPLAALRKMHAKEKQQSYTFSMAASYLRLPKYEAYKVLLNLYYKGFIYCEFDGDEISTIQLLPKIDLYINAIVNKANQKSSDFDNLTFTAKKNYKSQNSSHIASLDLNNMDLDLTGIDTIQVSEIKNIKCLPDNQTITLQKNRNFNFNGDLLTQFFVFHGEDFHFDYENFKFDLDSIDYLTINFFSDTLPAYYTPLLKNPRVNDTTCFMTYEQDTINGGMIEKYRFKYKNQEFVKKDCFHDKNTERYLLKRTVIPPMQDITGTLKVEHPDNKGSSDTTISKDYPIFTCSENANVYYDKFYSNKASNDYGYFDLYIEAEDDTVDIMQRKYERQRFYFALDTFTIKSLDKFEPGLWKMPGTFHSDVFAPIKDSLTIQEDTIKDLFEDTKYVYSLGFTKKADETETIYNGKGTAQTDIRLSVKGLQGVGRITYLTSEFTSTEITYLPDAVIARSDTFVIKNAANPECAFTKGKNTYIEWRVSDGHLLSTSAIELSDFMPESENWSLVQKYFENNPSPPKPQIMYDNTGYPAEFVGTLRLDSLQQNHTGKGIMRFFSSELQSDSFVFKQKSYKADTANFEVKSGADVAFDAKDVNVNIDYDIEMGVFKSNGDVTEGNFRPNKYKCKFEKFIWDMPSKEIKFGVNEFNEPENQASKYICTDQNQDSLSFVSYYTGYALENKIIKAYQVEPFAIGDGILTADTLLEYPDPQIAINPDGKMAPIQNASFEMGDENNKYKFYEVEMNVYGKLEYEGKGNHDYMYKIYDESGNDSTIFQPVFFNKIYYAKNDSCELVSSLISSQDTVFTKRTVAKAELNIENEFKINNDYQQFTGFMEIHGNEKYPEFEGATRIVQECGLDDHPLYFEGMVNPNNAYIPLDAEPKEERNKGRIIFGIHRQGETFDSIYPAFLTERLNRNQYPFFEPHDSANLQYNKYLGEYIITSAEKFENRDNPGNYVAYNRENCTMYGEGNIRLGIDSSAFVFQPIGKMNYNMNDYSITMEAMLLVDFFFPKKLIEKISDDIMMNPYLTPVDLTSGQNSVYFIGMTELLGLDEAKELDEEITLYGQYKKTPDKLFKNMVFSNVLFKYNRGSRSFISDGSLGIVTLNKTMVNRNVDGKIQIINKKTRQEITIYLELSESVWYYFTFDIAEGGEDVLCSVLSYDNDFNNEIAETKDSKRQEKVGRYKFEYQIAEADAKRKFLDNLGASSNLDDIEENLNNENDGGTGDDIDDGM